MQYWYLGLVCLAVMIIFIYAERKENYVAAVILKGLASSVFVLIGFLARNNEYISEFLSKVLTGLFLGMIADILLNLRFVFKKIGQPVFMVGILVFMAGHIFYILAKLPQLDNPWYAIGIGLILTAITMIFILRAITAKTVLKVFGVFYIGAVMLMTTVSVNVFILHPAAENLLFAIGAVCFLVSDIVLILNTFGSKTRFSLRVTNLTLYYIGQLLIAFSLHTI